MTREEIQAAIAEDVREELDWEGEVHDAVRLIEDLQLDSIKLLSLAMRIEDRFRIALDETDEQALVTIGDLVDLVETKRGS
ncbi:MAG: acyl carrier protein [Acidobacteriota bacterium]